ncbi:hypothetical protein MWU76_12565 [Gelidibacter sp. F2691]|nr:hypothetical protein [Gelidibacter sp. F2691]
MNTVKIGDKFEDKSYDLIVKAIQNGELGISASTAKVQRKVGYYSKDREKEIIFDLSIEVWPKNADRYTLLYLIECKSSPSGNNVPVDDVEEFSTKINQVAGGGVKGVMITDNKFQSGGLTFAKNKHKDHTTVGNDAIIQLKSDEDEFDLVNLPYNHQKECIEQIGLKTVDELKNYCE